MRGGRELLVRALVALAWRGEGGRLVVNGVGVLRVLRVQELHEVTGAYAW